MNLAEAEAALRPEADAQPAAGLVLSGLSKRFGATQALRELSLSVAAGELVGITGPSGAGKTTLARSISGLEPVDAGSIRLGGRDLDGLPPQRRGVAHMFESYALYPQLSVFDNIASPLRAPGRPRLTAAELKARIDDVLALTEMTPLAARLPSELSGGQKQRVALCRTLAQKPTAFLLDEPISHLDAKLRNRLRGEIRQRLKQQPAPSLWFTPDAIEALAVADRVAVLIGGEVRQVGTPEDLFRHPASVQVARLLGDPPMNLLEMRVHPGPAELVHAGGSVKLLRTVQRDRCIAGLRPADLELAAPNAAGGLRGEVYTIEPFGKYVVVSVRIGADLVRAKVAPPVAARVGDAVALVTRPERVVLFDAISGQALAP